MQDYEYFSYTPSLIDSSYFNVLYEYLYSRCKVYDIPIYDKVFPSRRISCVYTIDSEDDANEKVRRAKAKGNVYEGIPVYSILDKDNAPDALLDILDIIEEYTLEEYDYILIHIYRDGSDNIGWHNDREAMSTPIGSLSLGATRKFRFRKIDETKGWEYEFELRSGDFVFMKGKDNNRKSCQKVYKHTVPKTSNTIGPRINFTFRKYE